MKVKRFLSVKLSLNPKEVDELWKLLNLVSKIHSEEYDVKEDGELVDYIMELDGEIMGQLLEAVND